MVHDVHNECLYTDLHTVRSNKKLHEHYTRWAYWGLLMMNVTCKGCSRKHHWPFYASSLPWDN